MGNDNPKSEKTDDKRGQKEEKAEEESDPNQVWLLQCIFVLVSEDNLSIESYNLRWTRLKIQGGVVLFPESGSHFSFFQFINKKTPKF